MTEPHHSGPARTRCPNPSRHAVHSHTHGLPVRGGDESPQGNRRMTVQHREAGLGAIGVPADVHWPRRWAAGGQLRVGDTHEVPPRGLVGALVLIDEVLPSPGDDADQLLEVGGGPVR